MSLTPVLGCLSGHLSEDICLLVSPASLELPQEQGPCLMYLPIPAPDPVRGFEECPPHMG